MKKVSLRNLMTCAEDYGRRQAPALLTGLALAGLCVTVYKAYKAGTVIEEIIKEKKKDLEDVASDDKVTKRQVTKELVKEILPIATPVVAMGVATGACILGSNKISSKRIAVLSAGYSLAEKGLDDLNSKMKEVLGDKKTQEIKEKIVGDKLRESGPVDESKVIITGNGDVLCKDLYSGRYFRSNADKLGKAIRILSADCQSDYYVDLNDLYSLIGIPQIPAGDQFGWNSDDMIHGDLPITICAQLTEDGQPCLCLDYDVRVRADFRNLH